MPDVKIRKAASRGYEWLIASAPENSPLSAAITTLVPDFFLPCGGTGSCGKCLVYVRGSLSPQGKAEKKLLRQRPHNTPVGYTARLACMAEITGDVEIVLPVPESKLQTANPVKVQLSKYDGNSPASLGAVVDLGTTTISLLLYKLGSGALLAETHKMNAQGIFGADVLSRISYSNENGVHTLAGVVQKQIATMLTSVLNSTGHSPGHVTRIVVTANTCMLHFLANLDPRCLGEAPFIPESYFGSNLPGSAILGEDFSNALIYLPRCIGAFIGADVSTGLYYLNSQMQKNICVYVDIGTNGEIALYNNGELSSCSTAAGPAFEGSEISSGMPAVSGAVYKLAVQGGIIQLFTIDNAPAQGYCGTGLISLLALMLKENILDETGRIQSEGHAYGENIFERNGELCFCPSGSETLITQTDIRQLQLAKASICAGIEALLEEKQVNPQRVDKVFLAGGFGSYIDNNEAGAIGLIPPLLAKKSHPVGNAALYGAAECLFSLMSRKKTEEMAEKACELNLSKSPYFMQRYVENMGFEQDD